MRYFQVLRYCKVVLVAFVASVHARAFWKAFGNITISRQGRYFEKPFLPIFSKISIFRGKGCCLEIILNKAFLPIFSKISTFRGKGCFLEIILKKSFFGHITELSTFEEKVFYLDLFEKIVFWQYVKKYQHFEKRTSF